MATKNRRENTFRIDYGNVPKKPSSEEVHQFVGETLKLKRDEVQRIQYSRNLGVAFVKTTSLEVAQKVVENNDNKHELIVDGKSFKLRLAMEDGAVEVKLFNLSEDVTNSKIARFLMSYGELLSIREEVWDEKHLFAGLPTGVRVVRMIVRKNIPSYVTIDSETTLVSYYGQQQSCRHCGESVHNGVSCVQNKKLLVQKLATSGTSYADAAKNPLPSRTQIGSKQQRTKLALPKSTPPKDSLPTNAAPSPTPSTSTTMPPPASVIHRATEVAEMTNLPPDQQQDAEAEPWVRVTRRSAKNSDGNETDTSNSSRYSDRRPIGKKMRHDKSETNHVTDLKL